MKHMATQRPFVFINMAMSADGKIATVNHAVHSFGGSRDQRHLYELRATADAILCGARTLEMEEATLGNGGETHRLARLKRGLAAYPLRIVVSGTATIQPDAAIFTHRFSPIILLATRRAPPRRLAALRHLADSMLLFGISEIDFLPALECLHRKWNVRRLLCEGGGKLNDALFRADLVDEVHLTICPRIFGGAAAPSIADGTGFKRLADAAQFKIHSADEHHKEMFVVLKRIRESGSSSRKISSA